MQLNGDIGFAHAWNVNLTQPVLFALQNVNARSDGDAGGHGSGIQALDDLFKTREVLLEVGLAVDFGGNRGIRTVKTRGFRSGKLSINLFNVRDFLIHLKFRHSFLLMLGALRRNRRSSLRNSRSGSLLRT